MYWTSSSGRIELQMTAAQAMSASHPGRCDADVLALMNHPKIARQLRKIDPETLRNELKEYGAWEAEELADHEDNLMRMVWIAAGDIAEERGNLINGRLGSL